MDGIEENRRLPDLGTAGSMYRQNIGILEGVRSTM